MLLLELVLPVLFGPPSSTSVFHFVCTPYTLPAPIRTGYSTSTLLHDRFTSRVTYLSILCRASTNYSSQSREPVPFRLYFYFRELRVFPHFPHSYGTVPAEVMVENAARRHSFFPWRTVGLFRGFFYVTSPRRAPSLFPCVVD